MIAWMVTTKNNSLGFGVGFSLEEGLLSATSLAVTFPGDHQQMSMMGQAIEGGTGQQIIAENFMPLFKRPIAGDDDRASLIAFGNDLIQVLDGDGGERLQTEVIQDEQITVEDAGHQARETTAGPGGIEIKQQTMNGAGKDPQIAFERFDADSIRQVALPHTGGSAQQDILMPRDEGAAGKIIDQGAIECRQGREIKAG